MNQKKSTNKRCFVICPNPSVDILATISTIKANSSNRIQSEKRYPGGKGIHVALALAEMEVPTTLIGLWGDQNGNALIEACKEFNSNLEIIGPKIPGWNRSCYTFKSSPDWQDTEILGTGPTMTSKHFDALVEIIKDRKEEIESISICGSWPVGALPTYNQNLVKLGQELGITVFLDCTGEQLKNALLSRPFCIHLNKHEITDYFDEDFETSKNKITELCEVAAITDGSKGLYLQQQKLQMHANVIVDEVKSTVGSGDCLMAGIIAGYYHGLTLQSTAKMGVACGAANCINEDLGMLKKDDVTYLFLQAESTLLNI